MAVCCEHHRTSLHLPAGVVTQNAPFKISGARDFPRLTHYLFRYPAKFHPPVALELLKRYVRRGHVVLDPFCGSGTLLVEAVCEGIPSIGADIDPLAVFISKVKSHRVQPTALANSAEHVLKPFAAIERSADEYAQRMFEDLVASELADALDRDRLTLPLIPNIDHWFRRYVQLDLARIRRSIHRAPIPETHRSLLLLCFASIIRNSSNADPVPVSGLEVTSHMRQKEAIGRLINPFALFRQAINKAIVGVSEFSMLADPAAKVRVFQADATSLSKRLRQQVDVIITSPPYHGAVDYYRRHTLEMYWLAFTTTHQDRLDLLSKYIGRPKPRRSHEFIRSYELLTPLARRWELLMRQESPERADAFKHYAVAMTHAFREMALRLATGGKLVAVVGHSTWNGERIPTAQLMRELAGTHFRFIEQYSYRVSNRYMSYARHNGADINREYVVAFERR